MTDPADMDGAALGEAVMRAMGWVEGYSDDDELLGWVSASPTDLEMRAPLDFTGPDKWAAFGEVLAECDRRGWDCSLEFGGLTLISSTQQWHEYATTTHDWPAAIARAFLSAVAGEGRA